MIDKYILMHKDVEVGDLIFDTATRKFTFTKYETMTDIRHLPIGMYSYKDLDLNYKPTHEDIVFWLEDRVVPENRQNIDQILKVMGLLYYDFWELCRRTRAMCSEDYFWLSKGEKYEDVHLRHFAKIGRLYDTPIPFKVKSYEPQYKIVNNKIVRNYD